MKDPKVTQPLDPSLRAWLLRYVQTRGELYTLRKLQVSRQCLLRALSGLPVYGTTRGGMVAFRAAEESAAATS